jgi:hypothetical protein
MKTWILKLALGIAGLMLQKALKRLRNRAVNKSETKQFDDVLHVVEDHVKAMTNKHMPPEAKRAAVFANTKGVFKDVRSGMINLAIEIAYNALEAAAEKHK